MRKRQRSVRETVIIGSLLILFPFHVLSQGMYGFESGLGRATLGKSYTTPSFSGYYLKKLSRTFYLGAALSYQRYSFLYNYNKSAASIIVGDVLSIRQKSSYLLFTPKLDIGIGYRKYWHLSASFGPGLLLSGSQRTNKYASYVTTPPVTIAPDTMGYYTNHNIPVLISCYTFGVSRRIPTGRYWNIMISGAYSFIPTNLTTHGPELRTSYFCFSVGIMHKYPMVFVEY